MNAQAAVKDYSASKSANQRLILAPSLERRRLQCYLAQILADLAVLIIAFVFTSYIYVGYSGVSRGLVNSQVLVPIFLTIALYNGTYSIESLSKLGRSISHALLALVISGLFVALIAFLTQSGERFSRVAFLAGVGLASVLLVWTRIMMVQFIRWRCGVSVRNELIINDAGPAVNVPGAIEVTASDFDLRPDLNDPNALDRFGNVLQNIDRVLVSCPIERRAAWAMMLKGANVEGEVLDEQVSALGAQGARIIGNQGTLLVSAGPLGMRSRIVKRLFDTFCAGFALIALMPLLVIVALAIKLEDGGPVLFVQRRVGRGNRFFEMYKFRSMSAAHSDREGLVSASKDDQRVTRIGAFIRRTSIDELPQLLNVLKGDMSIVGPRPHALGSHAGDKLFWEVDRRYWHRHSLKPGLSGLAQVRGFRGATDSERDLVDRLQSDLEYLEGWTIVRDLQIIFLTLRVLAHDRAF